MTRATWTLPIGLALAGCSDPGPGVDAGRTDAAADAAEPVDARTIEDAGGGGLTWQIEPPAEVMGREAGKALCMDLVADGVDDWRMPTISELRSLVRGCASMELGGECHITDEWDFSQPMGDCGGCAMGAGPDGGCYWTSGTSGSCARYWSATSLPDFEPEGYVLDFRNASIQTLGEFADREFDVRCVRGRL